MGKEDKLIYNLNLNIGYAQGSLLKNIAPTFMPEVWDYLQSQVDQFLGDLPVWLQNWIANFGKWINTDFFNLYKRIGCCIRSDLLCDC